MATELKERIVVSDETGFAVWTRHEYESYIKGCAIAGAAPAYWIVTHFDEDEKLLSPSTPLSVEEAAKEYAKTEWKQVDDGTPSIDEDKYNAFLAGAAYRDKQGADEYNQINLYPVTIKPKKHGKYWCLLEPKPINYGYNLCQLEYGIGFDGKEGFLQENDSITPTHWFEFNFPSTPITTDIVQALTDANPYQTGDNTEGAYYAGWENCASELRQILSSQPSQGSVQALIDNLRYIINSLGAVNFSSHKQMREAIEGSLSLAEEALQEFNSGNQTEKEDWIKVDGENYPPKNLGVLVLIPDEDYHVTSGMWDISEKWVLLDEYRVPECEVAYWKLAPELPNEIRKEVEENNKIMRGLKYLMDNKDK